MSKSLAITDELVLTKIYLVRNQKIMLDKDLAALYGIETKVLKQAVKRNTDRFPEDFMFELTVEEFENLRSQIGTSSWGGVCYLPYAFTKQGVVMLFSVLSTGKKIDQTGLPLLSVFNDCVTNLPK